MGGGGQWITAQLENYGVSFLPTAHNHPFLTLPQVKVLNLESSTNQLTRPLKSFLIGLPVILCPTICG